MKNKEDTKIDILFVLEGKGAENLLIDKIRIYAKKIGGIKLDIKPTIKIQTGGGFNDTIKNKIIKQNNNNLCVIFDVDDKNDTQYKDLIQFINNNKNIMFLLSNRQIEYWFELCIKKEQAPAEVKDKKYYDGIKNELLQKFRETIQPHNIKEVFNTACDIEKKRQGQNFDYNRNKSYSTLYKLIDYLKTNRLQF